MEFDYKNAIKQMGYEPVCKMGKNQCSFAVYRARKNDKSYAIKFPKDFDEWDRDSLWSEYSVLRKVGNLEGIASAKEFVVSPYLALVKEYISGKPMRFFIEDKGLISRQKIYGEENRKFFRETLKGIHDAGFARLELVPENIVLSKGRPIFIDLGSAINARDICSETFENYKEKDIWAMEEYF